jgi:ribosomal protein L22
MDVLDPTAYRIGDEVKEIRRLVEVYETLLDEETANTRLELPLICCDNNTISTTEYLTSKLVEDSLKWQNESKACGSSLLPSPRDSPMAAKKIRPQNISDDIKRLSIKPKKMDVLDPTAYRIGDEVKEIRRLVEVYETLLDEETANTRLELPLICCDNNTISTTEYLTSKLVEDSLKWQNESKACGSSLLPSPRDSPMAAKKIRPQNISDDIKRLSIKPKKMDVVQPCNAKKNGIC